MGQFLTVGWVNSQALPTISGILHATVRLKERKSSRQLRFVNKYRRKHRLEPLKAYYELDKIAKGHSRYMARHRKCNHDGFEHRANMVRKLTRSGYVGENCIRYYPAKRYNKDVARNLVKGWMKSPGHRTNLPNPKFRKIGIGIVTKNGYVYATQIFTN